MEIDWLELWSEMSNAIRHPNTDKLVTKFKKHASERSGRPDPLLDFVLNRIGSGFTVLDIGAGSGRWTIPLARLADSVTAVEPLDKMLDTLRQNAAGANLKNIHFVQSTWEEAAVQPHDVVVCAHAVYASPDFAGFVRKMEHNARKTCCLAIRLPPYDGILGELSRAIYGHSHDSPNAVIAYNALYSMGIYSSVLVEEGMLHWTNNSLEEAFSRAKRHLRLESSSTHDTLIRDTLTRRLRKLNDCFEWPDGMRSALLWWSPQHKSK